MIKKVFTIPEKRSLAFWTILVLFLLSSGWIIFSLGKIILSSALDFKVLWLASKDLITTGKNPYTNPEIFTGVGYPANILLFYAPLTIFEYKIAQGIFVLLSFVAFILSVFISFKVLVKKIPLQYFLLALALTFLSFPTKFTLGMGQNNSIALLILLFSYFLYKKGKLIPAGIVLGAAISFKTVFGFFALFFLLRKRWKVVVYSLLTTGIFVTTTALISNYGWYDYYITEVVPPLLDLSGREIYYNQGIMGFVSRLIEDVNLRKNLTTLGSLLPIVPASYLAYKKKSDNLSFSFFITTLLLIDTLSWQHHFVWLMFPFIILSYYIKRLKNQKLWWLLLGGSYLLLSWNFRDPALYSSFPAVLLLSNQFYGTVLLWFLNYKLLLKDGKIQI